ncbi:MAG: DoxX family protein [Planctomycetaceae bacterium]|nr:DoxX family protein [Planctomycetaceae bacterium]
MPPAAKIAVNILGRACLIAIFLSSALANKIPNFSSVAKMMGDKGIPAPQFLLAGAILFLIVGSLAILVGYKARIGAALLLVFLILATYWFHDFWNYAADEGRREQQISFMKNLGLAGAMLMIIAAGSGPGSLDKQIEKERQSN